MNTITEDIYITLCYILKSRDKEEELLYAEDYLTRIPELRKIVASTVKELEKLINIYFNRTHWYNKLRVTYDTKWHHLKIKQPLLSRISDDDVKLIQLKRIVNKARKDMDKNFTEYAYSRNLIDIPV